jgi:hypothetical protein
MPPSHDHQPNTPPCEGHEAAPVPTLPDRLDPQIERSQNAFRRDLPELLRRKDLSRQWVAYHGDQRVAFGRSKTELYQECLRRGLVRGTFVVRSIEPEFPRDIDPLPDV